MQRMEPIVMFRGARGITKGFAAGLALIALTGCWEEESRPLVKYTPGVYTGKPDTPVSQEALAEARSRAMRQAGLAASVPGGGGGAAPSSSVRPPGGSVIKVRPTDSGLSRSALEAQRTRTLRSTGQ
jgi:hypothetical protein